MWGGFDVSDVNKNTSVSLLYFPTSETAACVYQCYPLLLLLRSSAPVGRLEAAQDSQEGRHLLQVPQRVLRVHIGCAGQQVDVEQVAESQELTTSILAASGIHHSYGACAHRSTVQEKRRVSGHEQRVATDVGLGSECECTRLSIFVRSMLRRAKQDSALNSMPGPSARENTIDVLYMTPGGGMPANCSGSRDRAMKRLESRKERKPRQFGKVE